MAVYVTGDTHGAMSIAKISYNNWPISKLLDEDDILIIVGDFGLLWSDPPDNEELYWLKWLSERKYKILFLDGNHENFNMINKLPTEELFGGKAGKVRDNIFHLRRGEVYTIEGMRILVYGGATSIDKEHRLTDISWWPEEVPNWNESNNLFDNAAKYNHKFDYILTHTAPTSIVHKYLFTTSVDCPVSRTLDELLYYYGSDKPSILKFKKWFFGHFHRDKYLGEGFHLIFDSIIKL